MGTIHDVRYFDSDMTGAPSTAGMAAAGRFLAILDACAVNGFNLKAVTSLTVANGVATATTDGDHGFRDYTVIRLEGATPSELNGDWKVQVTAGNTFTFETTAADGTATGTLSAKTAPLGWTKEFSATNVGVYRPKTGLRHFFRVNDASAAFVAIRGYEVMTASGDAGTNPFPTATQLSGGVGMSKYCNSTSYQPKWFLVGDDRCLFFVFCPDDHLGIQQSHADWAIYGFGEAISYTPNDLGSSFVIGSAVQSTTWTSAYQNGSCYPSYFGGDIYSGCYFSRPYSQELGAPSRFRLAGSGVAHGWGSSSSASGRTPLPNPADLSLLFHHPVVMQEEISKAVRAEMPGAYQPLHVSMVARVGDVVEINGRKIMITHAYDNNSPGSSGTGKSGTMGWDITGPWR